MKNMRLISTQDGSFTLLNKSLNETYHSQSGAIGEARHVFLKPLAARGFFDREMISVLDVGFGLGVNALCYFDYFLACNEKGGGTSRTGGVTPPLRFVSIENDSELLKINYAREHVGDNQISDAALLLLAKYKADLKLREQNISAEILLKNADAALDDLISQNQKFDVVMQDPFSPKNNPECWSPEYFSSLAKVVREGGVVLSYSVARSVCDALKSAGFVVQKIPGFGQKREQLFAVKRG